MRRSPTALAILLASSALLVACTSPSAESLATDESRLVESPKPREGSSIRSPSVDPTKRYWGARSIERLVRLGYLTEMEAAVAERADGIIATNPSNQKLGVDELATLESPEHASSLFPDERAVIPKLWKILLIDDAPDVSAADASLTLIPAESVPTAETKIAATSRTAQRVQLTCDSDSDPSTLTSTDIECAYADRASYTPREIEELRALVREIAKAGAEPTQSLTLPATAASTLFTASGVTISASLVPSLVVSWRTGDVDEGALQLQTRMQLLPIPANTFVVQLDHDTGAETDARAGGLSVGTSGTRVEIWTGGTRVAQIDLANGAPAQQTVPFGMPVTIGGESQVMSFTASPPRTELTGDYVPAGSNRVSAPKIPPRAYRISGVADGRLYLYAQGYGRWVTSTSTQFCFPERMSGTTVTSCVLFDATTGRNTASVVFSNLPAPSDSPAIGHTTGSLGAQRAVYPL